MYKLMIVEDEPIEREAIRLMIENSCDFIEVVAVEDNGYSAIEKARQLQLDIVIMDINMPGINGLDTIKEMIKIAPKTKYLILSSYHRFEYAKEAISLGVEDFIVKPAKLSQIRETLEATVEKIKQEKKLRSDSTALLNRMEEIRPIVESDCVYGLLYGLPKKEVCKMFSFLGFDFTTGFSVVISLEGKDKGLLEKVRASLQEVGLSTIGRELYNKLVLFIFSGEHLKETRTNQAGKFIHMLALENNVSCCIGVGEIADELMDLQLSYRQAEDAARESRRTGRSLCIYSDELELDYSTEISIIQHATQLSISILDYNKSEVDIELNNFLSGIFLSGGNMGGVQEKVFEMFLMLEKKIKGVMPQCHFVKNIADTMGHISGLASIREIESYVKDRTMRIVSEVRENKEQSSNMLTEIAQKQIASNYSENISLESLADSLEITPFYLSRLIKKNTGKTFTELLTERRIARAKELLEQSKSIKEITFLTGFNSQNYFTKVFKKTIGVTPTEYRSQRRRPTEES